MDIGKGFFVPELLFGFAVRGGKRRHPKHMKHLLTAAFAALALGAAQAIIAQPDWTATDNWGSVGDLALSDGCGTLSALITIPASFSANKAAIFKIGDDMLAGGSADIGFRLAGADSGGDSNGNLLGVTSTASGSTRGSIRCWRYRSM